MTDSGEYRDELPSFTQAFPALSQSLSGYLAALDSLPAPDRRTHELIRLACTVIVQHGPGVERHARLAAELGATWEDVIGTLALTQPSVGLIPARIALPYARAGYEAGVAARSADTGGGARSRR